MKINRPFVFKHVRGGRHTNRIEFLVSDTALVVEIEKDKLPFHVDPK